jgi:2-phospho-L-lactate guanylyltransferase
MLADVLTSLNRVSGLAGVAVMTRDEEVAALAGELGVIVIHESLASADLNSSLHLGIANLRDLGADQALIVPADVPLIDPADVEAIISLGRAGAPIVIPNRDRTGTNALLVRVDPPFLFSFGPDSYDRHLACKTQGQPVSVNLRSLSLDVDTAADLADLQAKLRAPVSSAVTADRTAVWLSSWRREALRV